MRKKDLVLSILFFVMILFISNSVKAADWRFPIGLTIASGFSDIIDLYEDNLSGDVDGFAAGISLQPYVQFKNGCGIGAGIGPIMAVRSGDAWEKNLFIIPFKTYFQYAIIPQAKISPYISAGGSYPITDGDYLEGVIPGIFGAVGVEFFKNRGVGLGIEISYDSSELEMEKKPNSSSYYFYGPYNNSTIEKIKPCGFMMSVYAVF